MHLLSQLILKDKVDLDMFTSYRLNRNSKTLVTHLLMGYVMQTLVLHKPTQPVGPSQPAHLKDKNPVPDQGKKTGAGKRGTNQCR